MEILDNGCLKILMTEEDLRHYGLSFEALDYRDRTTRTALRTLMQSASEQVGFTPTDNLLVEALPLEDGCLLLITPETSGRRIRLGRARGPYIYALENSDRLLQLAAGWARLEQETPGRLIGSSSLYRCDSGYRLVLYPGGPLPARATRLLETLTQPVGEGDAAAAFTAEHGVPIAVGDALERLTTAYSA